MAAFAVRVGDFLFVISNRKIELPSHIINKLCKGVLLMVEKNQPSGAVKNVFKNGRMPTKEEYTRIWIKMINQIEREKVSQ